MRATTQKALRYLFDQAVGNRVRAAIDRRVEAKVSELLSLLSENVDGEPALRKCLADKPWKQNFYIPPAHLYGTDHTAPFMQYSTCCAADFMHPRFSELSAFLALPPMFHRKYWEWVLIIHTAITNHVGPGRRVLGFGVGAEPLSSAFAKLGATVVGTDAPPEIGVGQGWSKDQVSFAESAEKLFDPKIVDRTAFERLVSFEVCDMNNIRRDLTGFDFCWSSCCLEHLGSLKHGLDFIVNSVESTLKVGGIACHTTEFNMSSNDATVEDGPTVLYRKCDLEQLIGELRRRGHKVDDIRISPITSHVDTYVDTPPYSVPPHLKLDLYGHTSTSIGLTITRGR